MNLRPLPARLLVAALAAALCALPAHAEKPEWAGKGKGHDRDDDRGRHFKDEHRRHVREYYEEEYQGGRCPPGLAKKHNGCLPPGQERKWRVGRPIPAGVVVYDVPPALVVTLGAPPAGHKYVRVAADILLIAVGTKVVVDAINDLGRR